MSVKDETVLKAKFKGQEITQAIQDLDINAFLNWCHNNKLDDLAYRKDFGGKTIAETTEELRRRMHLDWEIKGLVVAYLYDVRPEFIKRVDSLDDPDAYCVGYYYLNPLGKYNTLYFNKEFALELMYDRTCSDWRSDVGLKKESEAWKQMCARIARASLLSG